MASDLNIVYKISADITGLKDGVDKTAKAAEGLETTATNLTKALSGLFALEKVERFAETVITAASAFQKMADQTGLSTDEVQKFNYIASQSDTSIESLIGAVQNLQQRLGDDNSGAAGAFNKLGINAEAFNKLGTYEQMTSLSEAVRNIKDPTEQASVAAALFGKTWKEILPAIKSGMKDVGEQAPIMAQQTVESLKRIDDALKAGKAQATAWGGSLVLAIEGAGFAFGDFLSKFNPEHFGVTTSEILKLQVALNDPDGLKNALIKAQQAADGLTKNGLAPLGKIAEPTKVQMMELNEQTRVSIEQNTKDAEAIKKATEALKKWNDSVTDATIHMNLSTFTLHRFGAIELPNVESSLKGVDTEIHNLASTDLPNFNTNIYETGKRWKTAGDLLHQGAVDTLPLLSKAFTELAQVSGGAFGGIAKAAAQMVTALNLGRVAITDLQKAEENGTATAANYIESLTGIVSAMYNIGQVLLKIIPSFGDFGNIKQISNMIQLAQHLKDIGLTLDQFKEKAKAAGVSLDKLFADAHDPEKFKKDLQDITDALNFQDDAMKFLNDTVQKYGFSIEELGPKFAQQNLTKQAFDLEKEFRALEAAGIDVSTISEHMKDAINDYLHAALKTGAAVPESMRAILQQLANMGLLTDENGNAITDLEAAGVHFSKTLDQQFSDLITTINKLVDAITRGLGGAIDSIPRSIDVDANVHVRNDFPSKTDEGPILQDNVQAFATGGIVRGSGGIDTIPALLSPGEMVLTREQQAALGSTAGASGDVSGDLVMAVDGEVFGRIPLRQIASRGKLMREFRTLVEQAST